MSKPLDKIDVDKIQRQIIGDFADIISKEIDQSQMVIKGFLWKALRKWQKEHGMTHSDTERDFITPDERIQQTKEIFEIFRFTIVSSIDINSKALETAIRNSLRHYEQHYANR